MKVVLFCGGLGTRLRDYSDSIPKPMVPIGLRPVLWHVMKYYASYGHKEFILCLGYKGEVIKDFFLRYDEAISNDFVLSNGGKQVDLITSDIDDWQITFVETGVGSNLGQRLMAVRRHLDGESMFLANYADGLTDLDLPDYLAKFEAHPDAVGQFLAVRSPLSFHATEFDDAGYATSIQPIREAALWVNGGYFAFRNEIFDYIRPGEELVIEPFQRLVAEHRLLAYRFDGYWGVMDTFKDKQALDDLYERGPAPWEVWKTRRRDATKPGQPA